MFAQGDDRGAPGSLRGWLSDVYFPSLLDGDAGGKALDALASRLGPKATVDDPLHGRASGLPALRTSIDQAARWLGEHGASYARGASVTGIDRDVTEGTLSLTLADRKAEIPVAVVAERRKEREVELRVYFAAPGASGAGITRGRIVPAANELALPEDVSAALDALTRGDLAALEALFEVDGAVRDARGVAHARSGGALRAFFERVGAVDVERGGAADDGRACLLEYTLVKARGADVAPRGGALVFERGDSGLVRTLRVYGELAT